ncbi:MAG TPA: GNAT family protein [Candidatus Baltobacteraceae bacterium]|nr:GNAT family protein [Candidatus Baltobacteraceae bacterium]
MDRANTAESRGSVGDPPRITAALVDFCLHVDEHTEVRLLRADDADVLYDVTIRNRESLTPWMSWMDRVIDVSDTYAFLRTAEKEAYEHSAFKAGIWRQGSLIGCIDLHQIDWLNGNARIGYWLDKDYTGHGIMSRAVRLLVEYAFEALDLHRIEIHVATENHRSRRIPERLGFTMEGVLRQVQRLRGAYYDHALYALLRDEDVH